MDFCNGCPHATDDETGEFDVICVARPDDEPFLVPDECPVNLGEWGAWRAGLAQLQDEGTYGMIWVQPRPVADPGRPWQTPFTLFNAVGWSL